MEQPFVVGDTVRIRRFPALIGTVVHVSTRIKTRPYLVAVLGRETWSYSAEELEKVEAGVSKEVGRER